MIEEKQCIQRKESRQFKQSPAFFSLNAILTTYTYIIEPLPFDIDFAIEDSSLRSHNT